MVILGTPAPPLPTLDTTAVARGARLYNRFCAACHGESLEGAPDWKQPLPDGSFPPPPHDATGHTWHHPDSLLLEIITEGGDPAQRNDLLAFFKSTWSDEQRRSQWWLSYHNP